ncbi:MAG: DUF2220 family protein [Treponema sp.]|jgi:hypothetical protein|nr:DUF2220 family protein [Treponema sp.]
MTGWEKKIINVFIRHYFDSASAEGENRDVLRVSSSALFPNFDSSGPDEKVSYLEAAESLQQKGIIKLYWEKRGKGERLRTLICEHFEKLFDESGRPYPQTEAEKTRALLNEKIGILKKDTPKITMSLGASDRDAVQSQGTIDFLEFLSRRFGPREIEQGIDKQAVEDFVRLLEYCREPARHERLTTRALSILLYRDSKRLESLLGFFNPLLTRAQKTAPVPDLSFLERSYPETMIAGNVFFSFKDANAKEQVFYNRNGSILGFPLETVELITGIGHMSGKDERYVLTVENKETFFALSRPQKRGANDLLSLFDCFLYAGGYSNRATAAMIKKLAIEAFIFYHAGDLDPDGILILQHVQELAKKPVTPLRMDAVTFSQYHAWARPLSKPMLRQIEKIREETRANPDLAGLLRRIEETGMGVEQEIIDYR